MKKTRQKLIRIGLHLLCWIIWYSATNISAFIQFRNVPWIPAFYNFITLALIFYIIHYLSNHYIKRVSFTEGVNKHGWRNKIVYFIGRWEVLSLFSVIFSYIFICWNMEHYFLKKGLIFAVHTDYWAYSDARLSRMSFYISGGVALTIIKKLLTIIKGKNEFITFMQWHTIRLRNDAKKEQQIRKQFIEKFFFNREN
jgi:hypothetical protein